MLVGLESGWWPELSRDTQVPRKPQFDKGGMPSWLVSARASLTDGRGSWEKKHEIIVWLIEAWRAAYCIYIPAIIFFP